MPLEREFGWPGGDVPGPIHFQHGVDDHLTRVVSQALDQAVPQVGAYNSTTSLRGLQDWPTPAGSYRMTTDSGAWFVRISSRIGEQELEQSITIFLKDSGVPVSPILGTCCIDWEEKPYRVDIRPLIRGRHFESTLQDLSLIADSLRRCHDALQGFPRSREVKRNQIKALQRHLEVRDLVEEAVTTDSFEIFYEREDWARENRRWLAEMVEEYDPRFHAYPGAQCLHGEIHPANVVFRTDGDDEVATLVDFETSVHAYAPPHWDLAYFIQRFVLSDNPSSSTLMERFAVIERAYGSELSPLSMMMRQTSWYCVACAVGNRLFLDMSAPVSEYRKFVRLEGQAKEMRYRL